MNAAVRSVITGEFSVSDLLREAAERSIDVHACPDPSPSIQTPTMSGILRAEEVQPGLLMSAYDLTHIADGCLEVEIGKSVICAVLLDGESQPMTLDRDVLVPHLANRVGVLGLGQTTRCRRAWFSGTRARAFGITLKPNFLDRFASNLTSDDLTPVYEMLEPGFRHVTLPWLPGPIELGNKVVGHDYGGQLAALYHESHALNFLVEIAIALKEERDPRRRLRKLQYERALHAREILDRSLSDPPKALDLARTVGVNLTTLQANFKEAFGTTIFGYVRLQRLKMGRILIVERGMRVAEAGASVGFTNPAAFTAAYRKQFGRPPTADQGR